MIISSEFPPGPGGIGQHAFDLASKLSLHREVMVLANADYADIRHVKHFDSEQKFLVHRFKRKGKLTYILKLVTFAKIVNKVQPSHIFFTGLFPLWLIAFSSLLFPKMKRIAIIHGHEPSFGPHWQQYLTRMSLSLADTIIAVSKFAKDRVIQNVKHATNPIIIPNGISINELSSWSNKAKQQILSKESPDPVGYPILITIGHTSPRKGQHNVISALPTISKQFPDVMYYCIGRDVRNKELRALAKNLNVEDKIVFIPPLREKWQLEFYYKKANIFMLLSENQPNGDVEGFGIVALEANFFGTPVIGARGCGVEDAVSDTHSGRLVDPKNVTEITSAVCDIMKSSSLYRSNARLHAARFDWDNIINTYLKLI